MFPSFDLGFIEFPAYFTFLMVGYTFVVLLAHRDILKRGGVDGNRLLDLALVMIVAGILGARLLHVAADGYWEDYKNLCVAPLLVKGEAMEGGGKCTGDQDCVEADKGDLCHPEKGTCHAHDCFRAFKFWYGGLVYYGGLALAVPLGFLFIWRFRMPRWKVADLAGYAIPLGLVFGRMGCFLSGCCWGETCPADSSGGLSFPRGSPVWDHHVTEGLIHRAATESLPVYPTQVWEAAGCLVIFLYLYFWRRKRVRFDGQLFALFLMQYAVLRFIIEFWRDDPRGALFDLSTSQWMGIPLFVFGAVVYAWRFHVSGTEAIREDHAG